MNNYWKKFIVSLFTFSSSCYNFVLFCLIQTSVLNPAEYTLPSIREISVCMLVYVYENKFEKNRRGYSSGTGSVTSFAIRP